MRITYSFPRAKERIVHVFSIVGLYDREKSYLPMMWEFEFSDEPGKRLFDFKYLEGKNVTGLARPAVLSQEMLRRLFALYCEKTSTKQFP